MGAASSVWMSCPLSSRYLHIGNIPIRDHDILMAQEPRQPVRRIDLEADILQHADDRPDARCAPLIRIVELVRACKLKDIRTITHQRLTDKFEDAADGIIRILFHECRADGAVDQTLAADIKIRGSPLTIGSAQLLRFLPFLSQISAPSKSARMHSQRANPITHFLPWQRHLVSPHTRPRSRNAHR